MGNLFSIPVYFVLFREATEASIIISVLLGYLNHIRYMLNDTQFNKLRKQVWIGTLTGLVLSLLIGGIIIGIWISISQNLWESAEDLWEGCFSLLSSFLIVFMGVAMLNTPKLTQKWQKKLNNAIADQNTTSQLDNNNNNNNNSTTTTTTTTTTSNKEKTSIMSRIKNFLKSRENMFFTLPFITVAREGVEGLVFMFGLAISEDPKALPISVIAGLITGGLIGLVLYKSGNTVSLRRFFILTTILLYFIAAGLFTTAIGRFENYSWNQLIMAPEGGDDVAIRSYNVDMNLFVLDWGSPNTPESPYQILNVFIGWSNVASYATIIAYIVFWIAVTVLLVLLKIRNRKRAFANAASSSAVMEAK